MTIGFTVRTTPRFERLLRRLLRRHTDLLDRYADAIRILEGDPQNRSGTYAIRKLEGVAIGEGQYRLRLGRWRFRYDVVGRDVVLHYCGLRREETYR
jgi:mRNA-degrading endonuclease RelE of RelBE toxin-antitoxin system